MNAPQIIAAVMIGFSVFGTAMRMTARDKEKGETGPMSTLSTILAVLFIHGTWFAVLSWGGFWD